MSHRPENIAELLIESKDLSELMVDLAYASVMFGDERLARELRHLRRTLIGYVRELRRECVLAARSPEDARALTGVLVLAEAIEDIGHAASDIARVVTAKLGIPDALVAQLSRAEEVLSRVRVHTGSAAAGRTLRELQLPVEAGTWVIAIRRGESWHLDPHAETTVADRDVLLVRGQRDGIGRLRRLAGRPERAASIADAEVAADEGTEPAAEVFFSDLDRSLDVIIEMKNAAEAAVGLAYAAVSLDNASLAGEVAAMEAGSNRVRDELESWVLRAAIDGGGDDLRGLLRLAEATDALVDAARKLSSVVHTGEELHPLIQLAFEETEEIATDVLVESGSRADGIALRALIDATGVSVRAVQRQGRWRYRPPADATLAALDRVIAIGSEEGVSGLSTLTMAPAT